MHPPPRRCPRSRGLPPVRACRPTQQHARRRLWDRLLPVDANQESNQVHASDPQSSVPGAVASGFEKRLKGHIVETGSRSPSNHEFHQLSPSWFENTKDSTLYRQSITRWQSLLNFGEGIAFRIELAIHGLGLDIFGPKIDRRFIRDQQATAGIFDENFPQGIIDP